MSNYLKSDAVTTEQKVAYVRSLTNEEKREALSSFNDKEAKVDLIVLRTLLTGVTDKNYLSKHGVPLAPQSAITGSIDVVKEYINAGVDIHDVYDNKVNIAFWAVLSGSAELIDFLASQNVDFNKGALRLAIFKQDRKLVEQLLDLGANPFVTTGPDMTPYSKLLLDSSFSSEEIRSLAQDMKSKYGSDLTPFDLQAENLQDEENRRNTGTNPHGVSKHLIQQNISIPVEAQKYLATTFLKNCPSLLSVVLKSGDFVVDPSFRSDLVRISIKEGVGIDYLADTLEPEDLDFLYKDAYATKNESLLFELENFGYKPSAEIATLVAKLG